jgi:tetratricopeptide (TPR) repeat protein
MRKSSLTVVSVAILLLFAGQHALSQQSRVAERETEWDQYVLPQSNFVRQTDPTNAVLFQIPSEWKRQQSDKLTFAGPHGAKLSVIIEKIPDGMPLRDYVSAMTQQLRSLPDSADSLVVRRTAMSGLEAREIMFESNADSEEVSRRIVWTTVAGPTAISLVLIAPISNAAEIEPYFKAVVQSVTLLGKLDYSGFAALRSSVTKDTKPARVDEVQSLVASLPELDGSSRQSKIAALASIFAASPDTAIDLVLDSRPMVRAAVFEAIAQSHNDSLEKLLLRALKDDEPYVSAQAAKSIATNPNVIDLLRANSLEWFNIESVARVWPFLSRNSQIKILQEIFAQPLVPVSPSPKVESGKPRVTVRATVIPPGSAPPPAGVQALEPTSEPSRQLNALTLMRELPASEFKLPLGSILAAKNDALTILALQIGWWRHELLPATELLKLLSSSNSEVRRLAALNLGQSGSVGDIKSIEGYLNKPAAATRSTPGVAADPGKSPDSVASLDNDLQLTISKIRLREQLSAAAGEAREQLIKKSLADPKLTEWVWYRFVREDIDRAPPAVDLKSRSVRPVKVLPLGENLFPKDVSYYAALPQPGTALDKLGSALNGLQLETARSQANFVLILNVVREQLAQQFDSPPGASPIIYSGINVKEPIALASWFAEGAPRGIPSAERKAIILRVSDRARFERLLTLYQRSIGNFSGLTDRVSGGVRLLTVLPAFLPLAAKAMLDGSIAPSRQTPFLKYSFVGATEWKGYSIKVVEQRRVESSGHMTRDVVYLTYLGDAAVLTPDLESLRDVLNRASSEHATLAANRDFQRLIETPGEAIYFSNLTELMADPSADENSRKDQVTESGALKISNSTWENSYQLQFARRDWLQPFIGFQPQELTSPQELLPRTTLAYYFMNLDVVGGWRDWSHQLFGAEGWKDSTSIWAMDFEKDLLPELGPECGVAILSLPNITADNWELPWIVFFKLKSEKLAKALEAGKLLAGSAAGRGPTQIKLKSGDFFAVVKGNFLILSNSRVGITALDQKEKLISSRDFSRASERAPAGVVAFGGYNLEAAISAIGDSSADPVRTQVSTLISSLANAFHSPNFYATATSDGVQGHFSLSLDREGRFSVSELSSLSKEYRLSYAQLEARGVPIQNQERLSSLKLRIRARANGEIDRIKEDVSSKYQLVQKISESELELRVLPRHSEPKISLALPIKGPEFASYLQPGNEIRSDDKSVKEKAHGIVGEERDAWEVARKLADWTYKNIKWKRVDYATAAQTLATLEADCLEFSQLYVAMARSLGLPARIVSGLAYSGASFGGHAWVEVYVGDWIEVDPTWGTDFVDATHIRNSANGALLTYAALNLVELEVLEAPRGMAEFQNDPRALAEKLCEQLPKGNVAAITSALDLAVLTNETPGFGTWDSLSDSERDAMSSAYHRVLLEISGFRKEGTKGERWRLLSVKQRGERAEAVVLEPGLGDSLVKLTFLQRNGAWFLSEMIQADTDLHIISETLQPTIKTILERRKNKSARGQGSSEFVRILLIMQKDPKAAVTIADRALKDEPKNQGLRHLKALALARNEQEEDAIRLWEELAGEAKPFAPALLSVARQYESTEDAVRKKLAIEFYTRYGELEPDDPRTHIALANLYDDSHDDLHAEAEHRAALRSDPSNTGQFVDFAAFLAARKRFKEAESVIDEADKRADAEDDLFGELMMQLYYTDDKTLPEQFARSQPKRMEKSALANLYLGYARIESGKSLQAIPLLRKAAALKNDWSETYRAMARAYRTLRNWTAALNAADTAIKIDAESSEGHYSRACALARLGRIKEALRSLEKAVELDPDLPETMGDEADLGVLRSKPAFKKLLPGPEPKQ